jgi:hypothetical protein
MGTKQENLLMEKQVLRKVRKIYQTQFKNHLHQLNSLKSLRYWYAMFAEDNLD